MSETTKLLPCPFCGVPPMIYMESLNINDSCPIARVRIECPKCGIYRSGFANIKRLGKYQTILPQNVINAVEEATRKMSRIWNGRTESDEVRENEQLL